MTIDEDAKAVIQRFIAAGHEPVRKNGEVETWEFEGVDDDGRPGGDIHEMLSCAKCHDSVCIWCVETKREEIRQCPGAEVQT